MKRTSRQLKSLCSLLVLMLQTAVRVSAGGSQFSSHVTVNTPARSFTHGVGDPLPVTGRRSYQRQPSRPSYKSISRTLSQSRGGSRGVGYPRVKPAIPFNDEDIPHGNSLAITPWHHNSYMEVNIPVLPPSPYKVDSPDPESLWPEGLFLPPIRPLHFASTFRRRADDDISPESDPLDPYLLQGSEAIAAVTKAKHHGHLYFHDIPHIQSLLANQELRVDNNLKPHRIASIRHTWPFNRP